MCVYTFGCVHDENLYLCRKFYYCIQTKVENFLSHIINLKLHKCVAYINNFVDLFVTLQIHVLFICEYANILGIYGHKWKILLFVLWTLIFLVNLDIAIAFIMPILLLHLLVANNFKELEFGTDFESVEKEKSV